MRIGIVGGGPSGMMAAYAASLSKNAEIILFEKNEKLGKKLYITGKGRCNITNNKDIESVLENIGRNRNFLYSSFYGFSNYDLIKLLNDEGLATKVERGDRVFPTSDKSSDVIRVFENLLLKNKIKVLLNTNIDGLCLDGDSKFKLTADRQNFVFDRLILATGGISYKATGSTGDGYRFLKHLNHTINDLHPSLVPIIHKDDDLANLEGVSLTNIELKLRLKNKNYREFGDLLFTKNSISGPTVLRLSSRISGEKKEDIALSIDLKPGLAISKLEDRIIRDLKENSNKNIINALEKLSTKSLVPIIINRAGISFEKKANQITKKERKSLIENIKTFKIKYFSLDDINRAIITRGGVNVSEINPSTMESKIVKGLFICGELLDVDGLTGGYNLQIAFSTGYLAGRNSAIKEEI